MTGDNGNRENNKGVSRIDRLLAARVRNLLLKEIEEIVLKKEGLTSDESHFRKELILRMGSNILPRMTEITGEDGGDLKINIISYGPYDPIQLVSRKASDRSTEQPV